MQKGPFPFLKTFILSVLADIILRYSDDNKTDFLSTSRRCESLYRDVMDEILVEGVTACLVFVIESKIDSERRYLSRSYTVK